MLKKYNYGLMIARLQPLHFGHIQLINRMLEECRVGVVAIGSSQESRTYGNPFSYKERAQMINRYYEAREDAPVVMPLKDIFNIGSWARYALDTVEKKVKNKINIYYCGNDQDGGLFMKEGIKVAINDRDTGFYKGLSASKIRQRILVADESWEQFVPAFNHKLIKKVYKGDRPKI